MQADAACAESHHRKLVKPVEKIPYQFRAEFWIALARFGDMVEAIKH